MPVLHFVTKNATPTHKCNKNKNVKKISKHYRKSPLLFSGSEPAQKNICGPVPGTTVMP